MFLLALLLQHFDKTLWLKCHRIQWLYLAVHGCKTYLNLNRKPGHLTRVRPSPTGVRPPARSVHAETASVGVGGQAR
jgi:hypothetical protein